MRKYFLPALWARFGGAIFIALVYQFYYGGGGDSFNFFKHSQIINSALNNSFNAWLDLILRKSVDSHPVLYNYVSQMEWYNDPSSYGVARVAAVLGLLSGTTYLPVALMFAFIAFTGVWSMYETFVTIYPKLHKPLAIAFLFIPSTVVWGSAIYKDTLCIAGLGWMTYGTFKLFLNKDFSLKNIGLLILSFYIIAIIKIYILLAFLPALSLWLLLSYSHKIRIPAFKFILKLMFAGITVAGFLFFSQLFADDLNKYSLDNIATTSATTRGWINYSSGDEGSAYDLGDFDPSIGGMLTKFPAAVVVTLFRPFPWEGRKLMIALSALEALLFLGGTVFVIYSLGFLNFFKEIFRNANLTFFFSFSIIFAFAVGISSYNFGALSRYKIPCLPFYSGLLFILYYTHKQRLATRSGDLRKKRPLAKAASF